MFGFGNKDKETQIPQEPRRRRGTTDPRNSDVIDMPINFSKLNAGSKEMDRTIRCVAVHFAQQGKDAFDEAMNSWRKGETVTVGWQSYLNNQSTKIGMIYCYYTEEGEDVPQGVTAQMTPDEWSELIATERANYYPYVQVDLYNGRQRLGGVELSNDEQDLFGDFYWELKVQFDGVKMDSGTTVYSLVTDDINNGILPVQNIGLAGDQINLTIGFDFSKAVMDNGDFDDNLKALEIIQSTLQKALKAAESACKAFAKGPGKADNQPENSDPEKHLLDYLSESIMGDENIAQSFRVDFENYVNGLHAAGRTDDQIIRTLRLTKTYDEYLKKAEDAKIEAEARQKNQKRVKTPKQGQNQDKQGKGKGGQKGQQGKKQQPKGGKQQQGDGSDKKKATGPIWNSEAANKVNDNLPKQPTTYWIGKFSSVDGFSEDVFKGNRTPKDAMMTIVEFCRFLQIALKAKAAQNHEDQNKVKIPQEIYAECKAAIEAANA